MNEKLKQFYDLGKLGAMCNIQTTSEYYKRKDKQQIFKLVFDCLNDQLQLIREIIKEKKAPFPMADESIGSQNEMIDEIIKDLT
jgi:hypothetical protein